MFLVTFREILLPSSGKVCEHVCGIYVFAEGQNILRLTLVADLYGTILVGRPLWTQFDDAVVLAVVFFALLSRSIGFQIFGSLKDIPLA